MNASFKKVMAGVTAVTIVAMNMSYLTVNAAAVNDGVAAVATDDITITSAGINGATVTVRVEKDGAVVPGVLATVAGNVVTVIDPDGVATGGVDAGYYVITFNTNTNAFGSATLDNSAAYNKVNVTATVVPTLSLVLATTNANLGVLTPGVFSAAPVNVNLTYSTNASNGLVVTMDSTGLKDTVVGQEINATQFAAQADADGLYTVATAAGANAATVTGASPAVAATQNVVPTTGGPVNAGVMNVKVGAQVTNVTKAGNYSDTLTFTVTGTF